MTGPRELDRVEAGDLVPTRMTVNGTTVELAVPARLTLADALRDRLGLTGTHVGCEHGVCGMCTVLVDGAAARSCLMFACQADGAEITTVEGLGSPSRLHPLQEAFGRHHALQCGFCTPGFLLSAYDLLRHDPGVQPSELPAQLSGVICRCTGYRNIVAAVAAVADACREPGTLPPPLGTAPRPLLPAAGAAAPRPPAAGDGAAGDGAAGDGAAGDGAAGGGAAGGGAAGGGAAGGGHPERIALPGGEPSVTVDLRRQVPVPAARVAGVLGDIRLLARCLPGAELTADLGDDWYAGRVRIALGPVRLAFTGVAQVAERGGGRLRVLAEGGDPAGGQAQAEITLSAAAVPGAGGGTVLEAGARVYLTGRIAGFGRSLGGDVAERMFAEFAAAVDRAASGERPDARPPGAISLLAAAVAARLGRILAAVFRRGGRRGGAGRSRLPAQARRPASGNTGVFPCGPGPPSFPHLTNDRRKAGLWVITRSTAETRPETGST